MQRPLRRLAEATLAAGAFAFATIAMGYDAEPAPQPAEWVTETGGWLDTSDRDAVVDAYRAEFGSAGPELGWRGSHERCDAGTSSPDHRRSTIRRVNYYRAMAGVIAGVTEEPDYSAKAQRTALMMSVEGSLTHSPQASFACFSPTGQEGAANSNLYLGRTGAAAVDGYIEDPGDRNIDVGHRNTVLHPPTSRMGVGDVGGSSTGHAANALWVFDDRVFDEENASLRAPMRERERFVAWPPRGYVPPDLVHPRWSFTRSGVDFSTAEVAMFRPGAPEGEREVPLEVVSRSGAPGHVPLPTIVWEPTFAPGELDDPPTDRSYLVVITGITPNDPIAGRYGSTSPISIEGVSLPGRGPAASSRSAAAGTGDGFVERSAYAYAVRVLGGKASSELTAGEFLARLDTSAPADD